MGKSGRKRGRRRKEGREGLAQCYLNCMRHSKDRLTHSGLQVTQGLGTLTQLVAQ